MKRPKMTVICPKADHYKFATIDDTIPQYPVWMDATEAGSIWGRGYWTRCANYVFCFDTVNMQLICRPTTSMRDIWESNDPWVTLERPSTLDGFDLETLLMETML